MQKPANLAGSLSSGTNGYFSMSVVACGGENPQLQIEELAPWMSPAVSILEMSDGKMGVDLC
jgi:hypothetical protein